MGNAFQVVFQVWFYIPNIWFYQFNFYLAGNARGTKKRHKHVMMYLHILLMATTPPIIQIIFKSFWSCVFKVLWNSTASVFHSTEHKSEFWILPLVMVFSNPSLLRYLFKQCLKFRPLRVGVNASTAAQYIGKQHVRMSCRSRVYIKNLTEIIWVREAHRGDFSSKAVLINLIHHDKFTIQYERWGCLKMPFSIIQGWKKICLKKRWKHGKPK